MLYPVELRARSNDSSYHLAMGLENEIKLRCMDPPEQVRQKLEDAGYREHTPRTHERDQLFDYPGAELRNSDRMVRLRSAGEHWVLTYKGPASGGIHKSREEIESAIEDGEAFTLILDRVGLKPTFLYEKFRTIFQKPAEPGIVTLDETPIGTFLELEGPADWVDSTALNLGFKTADYVTKSYAALYQEHRSSTPGVPSDMKF